MAEKLTIIAKIEAKEDKLELVKAELLKLIEPTLKENGCIQYNLHQDNQNPAIFIFYENWENRELWQIHMNNSHLKAYIQATEDAVENFTVYEMSGIGLV